MSREAQEITNEQCTRAAIMIFSGETKETVAKDLNVSRYVVSRILSDERYHSTVKELTTMSKEHVSELYKNELKGLVTLAISRLKEELKPGSRGGIEAVKVVLKTAGLLDQEQGPEKDTNITVILPQTGEGKETIVVESKDKE